MPAHASIQKEQFIYKYNVIYKMNEPKNIISPINHIGRAYGIYIFSPVNLSIAGFPPTISSPIKKSHTKTDSIIILVL